MPISDIFHDNDYDLVYTGVEHVTLEEKKVGFDGIKAIFDPDPEEGGMSLRTNTVSKSILLYFLV